MTADDKHWAKEYILDPLNGPDPGDETGPGTHFRSTFAPMTPSPPPQATKTSPRAVPGHSSSPRAISNQHTGGSSSTNPFRRSAGSSRDSHTYPTPPASASPRKEKFPASYREQAFASENTPPSPDPNRNSKSNSNTSPSSSTPAGHRRRASSLTPRYPGDPTTSPLAMLRKDSTRAHRAPHLRKAAHHGTDAIDRLDPTSTYHHESAYDAASLARNRSGSQYSPIAALAGSNAEALRATPRENIQDSLARHRPLEGTAEVPAGMRDRMGRRLSYTEGSDLMRERGGDYKRWPGEVYHPDDLKGKGEPSFSIERALKEHKAHGDAGIELQSRSRNKSLGHRERPTRDGDAYAADADVAGGVERRNTTGRKGLKKRLLGRKD